MTVLSVSHPSRSRRGFTLVELAIVLAVAALLFAGLWRLMSSGNQQMRDQAAADQMKQLAAAVRGYLATSEGQTIIAGLASGGKTTLPLPSASWATVANCQADLAMTGRTGFCDYLPPQFYSATSNSYGQTYVIGVRRDSAVTSNTPYSFMVRSVGGDVIPDTSGGRISGMMGNDGGFIYGQDVCGTPSNTMACGAYGGWSSLVSNYFAGAGTIGHVAARGAVIPGSDSDIWLARKPYSPAADYNTLQADTTLQTGKTFTAHSGSGGAFLLTHSAGTDNPVFNIAGSGCTLNTSDTAARSAANCNYAMMVNNGDVSFEKFVHANTLHAEQLIYDTTSDERLKHDVKPLKDILEKLGKIRALSFSMNSNNEKKLGVIAQDVEKVYPELIQHLSGGYLGVDYLGFIGPLIGAVHELKAENDALREQLKEQGAAIKELQNQMKGKDKP